MSQYEFNESQKRVVESIINTKLQIKLDKEAMADDIKALADQCGLKPAEINKIIGLIEKERAKGGEIHSTEKYVDYAKSAV